MKTEHIFSIKYDGESLANHTLDARELAGALVSVADLFKAINAVVNENRAEIAVSVKGNFKAGSFEIDLIVVQGLLTQLKDLFNSDITTAVLNASGIAGIATLAYKTVKNINGKRINSIASNQDNKILTLDDDRTITISNQLYAVLQKEDVISSMAALAKPLERNGIDDFYIGNLSNPNECAHITKQDYEAFTKRSVGDELLSESEQDYYLSIVSLSFKEDNKWRLADSRGVFTATIADNEFLDRIDQGLEAFAKGDILKCNLRTEQWKTKTGIKNEYIVIKVIEHKSSFKQQPLF
jgi:hypothetical protein